MSLTDDILKARKKRLEEEEKKKESSSSTLADDILKARQKRLDGEKKESSSSSLADDILKAREKRLSGNKSDDIAPVTPSEEEEKEEEKPWYKNFFKSSSAFDDDKGNAFTDTMDTFSASVQDLSGNVLRGVANLGEGITDLLLHGVSGASKLVGADSFADDVKNLANKNTMNDFFDWAEGVTGAEKNSIFGETTDSVAQGVGQVAGIILTGGAAAGAGLGTGAVSALTTGMMGASSMGSGISEAYNDGATDGEAWTYGAVKGAVDTVSELIFGGMGKAVNALGFSKGLSSIDDMAAKKLTDKISNILVKNIAQGTIKASAEGFEEVIAGIGTAAAKLIYKDEYRSKEGFNKLLEDENLLEQFVVGALTSGITQGGDVIVANQTGTDVITGLNKNETSVVDKVFAEELKEAEAKAKEKGEKLSNKEKNKLYEKVIEKMDRGELSLDTIEEVLGGDTYKKYKETVDSEAALKTEFEELGKKEKPTLADSKRYDQLEKQLEDIKNNSNSKALKEQLRNEVNEMTKGTRLGESYLEDARRGQAFTADLSKYKGKAQEFVKSVIESEKLNDSRATHNYIDFLAKAAERLNTTIKLTDVKEMMENGQLVNQSMKLTADGNKTEFAIARNVVPGADFTVKVGDTVVNNYKVDYQNGTITFESAPQGEITIDYQAAPNGWNTNKGEIVLNSDTKNYLTFVAGHEITHSLEKTKHYEKLQKALFDYARAKGVYESRRAYVDSTYTKQYAHDENYDKNIDKELAADLVGDYIFSDTEFIQKLYAQDQNIFKQIWDSIKHLAKMATAGSEEARQLEKAQMRFEQVWRDGAKDAKKGVKAQESDAKLSLSDIEKMSERDYNHHGWAKVNDLLDDREFADFMKKTGDKTRSGQNWYRRLANGHHMFEVGHDGVNNTVVISDGKFINPSIDRVYHIGLDNETDIEVLRELIYDYENTSEWSLQSDDIKEIFRDEPISVYTSQDFQSYRELRQGQKGAEGKGNLGFDSGLRDGRRSATKTEEYPLKTSSNDGVFFDGKKYSLTEYTDAEKKEHNKAVVDHFGKTYKWSETGYVLLDGTKLDLSGKHDGAPGGYRTVDHRDIVDALGSDYGDDTYSGSLVQFMSEGNIRISPESNGINLSVKPNKAQELSLQDFISKARGEVLLDIDDANGYTVVSMEYPRGTHSSKVLNDIREWFDNGKKPEVSNLSQFRYSLSESTHDRTVSPTFYSHMERVVDDTRQQKLGASSVVPMLRGKGVKAEEIKWSGIEQFLEGKKSVTKEELLEFIKGNQLQIEETVLSDDDGGEIRYTDDELQRLDKWQGEYQQKLEQASELWQEAYGENIPFDVEFADEPYTAITREVIERNGGTRGFRGVDSLSEAEAMLWGELSDSLRILDLRIRDVRERAEARQKNTSKTNWSQYKLDGGENYREYMFKMPGSDYRNQAMDAHWNGETGVLAHARVQDFDTGDGKMLFIEEIQSDWHNQGSKEGYRKKGEKTDSMLRRESAEAYKDFYSTVEGMVHDNTNSWYIHPVAVAEMFEGNEVHFEKYEFTNKQREIIRKMVAEEAERQSLLKTAPKQNSVPDAPFKQNYHEFVLKRLIREAAENGYDSIGWTTADIQSNRWSEDYAEGYRIEYDQDIPKFLNKYGKKWGATVGKTDIQTKQLGFNEEAELYMIADMLEDSEGYIRDQKGIVEVWTMPITESMKQSVLYEGQPQYSLSDSTVTPTKGMGITGDDIRYTPDIAPVSKTETTVDNLAPVVDNNAKTTTNVDAPVKEAPMADGDKMLSLDDEDAWMDAPTGSESSKPSDPFEERDWKEVGNRKTKAYMYENPEVKPFFQEAAQAMLGDLQNSVKGERWYNDEVYYDSGGEHGWGGTERVTTDDIAYLLDNTNYTYADIEKGLKAIIEDDGAENNACSKRIEFLLNDRLRDGYTDVFGNEVPANQDYLNMLDSKQVSEYSEESWNALFASHAGDIAPTNVAPTADNVAPVAEDVAPVKESKTAQIVYGDDAPQKKRFRDMTSLKEMKDEVKNRVLGNKTYQWAKEHIFSHGAVFESLSLKTGNRELQAKFDAIRRAESMAQHFIGNGKDNVRALNDIRSEIENSGKTEDFNNYMYHLLNMDRMSLETEENRTKREELRGKLEGYSDKQIEALAMEWIRKDTPDDMKQKIKDARDYIDTLKGKNKPVFGDDVTAEVSREIVAELEANNPEFNKYADEIYEINRYLREMLVDNGIISQETADLWETIYPHFVPIHRVGKNGLNVNVPLDTNRTGVNAPIKRAEGGNSDFYDLFRTMAERIEQTHKAVTKNRFGVELKNTLGTTIESNDVSDLEEVFDSIDQHEELLQKGENGQNPTFTVFENGKRVKFEITDEMYEAMKPNQFTYTNKTLNTINNARRNVLTTYSPMFALTNPIKDVQDILMNSQHPAQTYKAIPKAIKEVIHKGEWYQERMEHGGDQDTYFDGQKKEFKGDKTGVQKFFGKLQYANEVIEQIPRMAEYIASREMGRSIDVSMLDAARVTTNFGASGDLTNMLNRNGATFLSASVEGFNQQVRNVREAKVQGFKGWAALAGKTIVAGLPAMLLNHLLWDDDDEYEELSDYVKQNYYIVGKFGDGKFVRIPKGRTVAVIQDAFKQMENLITGNDEVDLMAFADLAVSNLAPNNFLDNNIIAPITQAINNNAWYGGDLVPTRLQDLPAAEQYDETTDSISKWLGEVTNTSPYKWNYILDQYSGGIGDMLLPYLTPAADGGGVVASLYDKFATDSVLKNQNVTDFYDTMDKLTANANSMYATDEDILMSKYMSSVNAEMSDLSKQKREVQNSNLSDKEKNAQIRELQRQINDIARKGLNTYGSVYIDNGYAKVGDIHYKLKDGAWSKITDDQLDKQTAVTSDLDISPSEYWNNKTEYDFMYEHPEKYTVSKALGGYSKYKEYSSALNDIKADKDANGYTISGSRKQKVIDYINNLDADYYTKILLYKNEYKSDNYYNAEIVEYLNSRDDISYDEMITILKELGFKISADGKNATWD